MKKILTIKIENKNEIQEAISIADCIQKCNSFIRENNVSEESFIDATISDMNEIVIGHISYNGKLNSDPVREAVVNRKPIADPKISLLGVFKLQTYLSIDFLVDRLNIEYKTISQMIQELIDQGHNIVCQNDRYTLVQN